MEKLKQISKEQEIEDWSDTIRSEILYSCKYDNRPMAWETIEQVEEHQKTCCFNPNNKSCFLCKHLRLFERPAYKHNHRGFKDQTLIWGLGNYRRTFCTKYNKDLSEEDILSHEHDECFEYTDEPFDVVITKEYKEFEKLLDNATTELDQFKKDYESS